jgi:tetratricopeptide (TPR) repeat protein
MKNELIHKADEAYKNGEIEKALNLYFDFLFANQPTAELFMKIGHCNKVMGDDENALEYYEKSLELESENYETLFNYSEALMYVGRYDDAMDSITKLIQITENTGFEINELAKSKKNQIESQKHNYQGGLLMKEQRFDEAKEEFLIAIDLYPGDKRNYANIGVIYLKHDDTDSAIIWMRKAIEVDQYYVRGYYNLGTILMKKALFKQAIDIFTKALEIEPDGRDSEDIRRNLSVAEENLNIPKTEIINILSGKLPQISNDYIVELSNSIFSENILSADFIISKNGKYKIIVYGVENKYEVTVKNDDLDFRLL